MQTSVASNSNYTALTVSNTDAGTAARAIQVTAGRTDLVMSPARLLVGCLGRIAPVDGMPRSVTKGCSHSWIVSSACQCAKPDDMPHLVFPWHESHTACIRRMAVIDGPHTCDSAHSCKSAANPGNNAWGVRVAGGASISCDTNGPALNVAGNGQDGTGELA